jgi:hypothetical protein
MRFRTVLAATLVLAPAITASGDTILFKDGTKKTVRVYKTTKAYVSFLCEGRIEVVARDKIKDGGIQVTGKPLTTKELAAALAKTREALRQRVRADAKKHGIKPVKRPVKVVTKDSNGAARGVKVVKKDASKTKATELIIDPFPDHPTEKETDETTKKK